MFKILETETPRIVRNADQFRMIRYLQNFEYLKQLTVTEFLDHYIVKAKIKPYYLSNDSVREVSLTVNKKGKVIRYGCNCPKVSMLTACTDVGLAIYFVNQLEINHIPYDYLKEKEAREKRIREENLRRMRELEKQEELEAGNLYLNQIKNKVETELLVKNEHHNVRLEAYFTEEQFPCIHFKIGDNKTYVVKNIFSTLDAIAKNEYYSYTKLFGFTHKLDNFDEDSQVLLQMLQKVRPVYQKMVDTYDNINKRYVPITNETIDMIYDGLSTVDEEHSFVACTQEPQKTIIKTSLNEDKNLVIELDDRSIFCGENNLYKINRELPAINRLNVNPSSTLTSLVRHLKNKNQMIISSKNFKDFYKFVINPIKEDIEIVGYQLDAYDQFEMERILTGDIDENGLISFALDLEYDDGHKASIFDTDAERSILAEQIDRLCRNYANKVDDASKKYLFDDNDDKTFTFIKEILPEIQQNAIVFISDALKQYSSPKKYQISLGVSISNDLLNIDVSSLDIPVDELAGVLKDYRRKKKFHRLKNGQLLHLKSDELEEVDQLLTGLHVSSKDLISGSATVDLNRAIALDNELNDAKKITVNRSKSFTDTVDRIKNVDKNDLQISSPMNEILRDYQKTGVQWMDHMEKYGFGGILADDMGLGKTLQVICLIKEKKGRPNLVICPSSLILNWQDEIKKFAPELHCLPIYGNQGVRKQKINAMQEYDIAITSYDYIRRDVDLYKDIELNTLILDEAQYIKNQKTKNAQCVKQLKSKYRFALTGTPIENNLAELWSIFDFLMPGYLFNYNFFNKQFEKDIVRNQDEKKQQRLKEMISPFILRRTKKEVLKELPEKVTTNLTYEFSDEEKKIYFANLASANDELQAQMKNNEVDKIAILALLTRLRQLCIEPRLVYDNITETGTKLNACMELLERLKENKQNCLLFSSFTSALDLIEEECKKHHISYLKLTGSTPKEERRKLVQKFQEGKTDVFLISLKAGGTGLNLTAASAVIHYDPWWNQSAENQATDRAYRIGQKNMVQVFKLIMKDSIEEKIAELQAKKKELADMFVEGNDVSINNLTTEELIKLFQ